MSTAPDHEFEELEDDSRIPPRPEELIADVDRDTSSPDGSRDDEGAEQRAQAGSDTSERL